VAATPSLPQLVFGYTKSSQFFGCSCVTRALLVKSLGYLPCQMCRFNDLISYFLFPLPTRITQVLFLLQATLVVKSVIFQLPALLHAKLISSSTAHPTRCPVGKRDAVGEQRAAGGSRLANSNVDRYATTCLHCHHVLVLCRYPVLVLSSRPASSSPVPLPAAPVCLPDTHVCLPAVHVRLPAASDRMPTAFVRMPACAPPSVATLSLARPPATVSTTAANTPLRAEHSAMLQISRRAPSIQKYRKHSVAWRAPRNAVNILLRAEHPAIEHTFE